MIKNKTPFNIGTTVCMSASVYALCAVLPATAQDTGQNITSLEEIVVTARKREESLQDIPVSVSAFTAKELAARQIDNISQISDSTPNLVFDSTAPISGSNSAASIFIRGVGQTDFTLVTDPGVGLYLDGVYIARSVGGVLDLVDVKRVEVLRGPQGALFGKNTIGGAISIVSKLPGNVLSGFAEIKTGTDDRVDVKGSIDLPISAALSVRLSYADLNQDGYVKDLGGGPNLSDTNARIGRVIVDYHPEGNFSATLYADATRKREQARAQKLLRFNPAAPAPTFGPFSALGLGTYDDRFLAGGPFVTHQGTNAFAKSDLNLYGLSLVMHYDFGNFGVKSITAYRRFTSAFGRDSDNSPFTIVETIDHMKQKQFSQEFQISGVAANDSLKWLFGTFYFKESGTNPNIVRVPIFDIVSGGSADNRSWAVFGQATYDLTEKVSLTIGARYTKETKKFLPDQFVSFNQYTIPVFGGAGFTDGQRILPFVESSRDFNNFSPMASLDYQWTDELMTYLSYSKGYKSGGFNQRVFPPRSKPGSFEPEKASVYEFGWKWANDANTIRFNGAGFYTDYTNIQVKVIDVVAPGTGNAARGRIYGGEMELEALVTNALTLQFSAGYLNTKYTAFAANFDPAQGINKNSSFVNSPKWSLSGSLSYVMPVSDYGNITFRGDWSYRSKVYNDAANSEFIAQGDLHLFNAGATFNTSDEKWQLALQVRNITNKIYVVTGNDEFNGFGYTEVIYARPREWSLSVKRLF